MKKHYIILQDKADTKAKMLFLITSITVIALHNNSIQIKAAGNTSTGSFVLNYLTNEEANAIFNQCIKSIEDFYSVE